MPPIKKDNRPPTHPGEILREEFLKPMGMSQGLLAELMGVPLQRVNTIIAGKRGVTPETAILLANVLGTTPEFWMNLQNAVDLYQVKKISTFQRYVDQQKKSLSFAAEYEKAYRQVGKKIRRGAKIS